VELDCWDGKGEDQGNTPAFKLYMASRLTASFYEKSFFQLKSEIEMLDLI
jgi:hypothetical protein